MRKRIKIEACERCPLGRERPATRTVHLSVDHSHWVLQLCEEHGKDLDRDTWGWGSLGQLTEPPSSSGNFDEGWRTNAKRAAEQRTRQAAEDRLAVKAKTSVLQANPATRAVPRPLPPAVGDYHFTDHARERYIERKIKMVDILWALSMPTIIRPGDRPGTEIRIRDGVKVVLCVQSKEILTVANTKGETNGYTNHDQVAEIG